MDTETKKSTEAISLVTKAFSQTGISVLALLSLLVAAILNQELWIQLAIALVAVALSWLIAARITKAIALGSTELLEQKSAKENQINQLAKYWPILTVVLSLLAAFLSVGSQFNLSAALTVFSAGLLLTNSHSLALVIPVGALKSLSAAADLGIVIRSREAFEKLAKLNLILFTKSGLLTDAPNGVNSVQLSTKSKFKDESKLLTLAASVESLSKHAFAQAIVKSATNSKSQDYKA